MADEISKVSTKIFGGIEDDEDEASDKHKKYLKEYKKYSTSRQIISDWEQGYGCPKYPNIQQLYALCEIFNCDIWYLLGEVEEKTKTIHDICERTHLSEKAVTNLLKYCDGISREHNARLFDVKENRYSILNALLENDDFFRLLYDIDEYKKGLPIGSPEKFDLWATSQVSGNLQREFANIIDDITETKELRKQRQELIDKAKLKTPKDE